MITTKLELAVYQARDSAWRQHEWWRDAALKAFRERHTSTRRRLEAVYYATVARQFLIAWNTCVMTLFGHSA